MRELEASLQQFGEFVLKARLVKEKAAPYCVRWVRRFLTRPASDEPLADQVRRFCDELERDGRCDDWQVRQAEHALRIYFVNFLQRTDWQRKPASAVVDERGHTSPLAALEQLRHRLRTRHYSYRTECSYADWVRRFFDYLAERQGDLSDQTGELAEDVKAEQAQKEPSAQLHATAMAMLQGPLRPVG